MTFKELKDWFFKSGYYIGCMGCDVEVKEGIINEYSCKQEDMMQSLVDFINGKDDTEERTYYRFENIFEFNKWCKEGGWEDSTHFCKETGVSFDEIRGKLFQVVHGRVYIEEQ